MGRRRQFFFFSLVFCLLLSPCAQAQSRWHQCGKALRSLFFKLNPAHYRAIAAPDLTQDEIEILEAWLTRFQGAAFAEVITTPMYHLLPWKEAALAWGDLDEPIRRKLLTVNGEDLTPPQRERRFEALRISPLTQPILRPLIRGPLSLLPATFKQLEQDVALVRSLPKAKQIAIRRSLRRYLETDEILFHLTDSINPNHEIRFTADRVIFPEGPTYRVLNHDDDMGMLVEVPLHKLIRREMVSVGEVYQAHKQTATTLSQTWVLFGPDGRFLSPSGEAKAIANAQKNGGYCRLWIRPAWDGRFYSYTHLQMLMYYDPRWNQEHWLEMPDEERKTYLEDARNEDATTIRALYHAILNTQLHE